MRDTDWRFMWHDTSPGGGGLGSGGRERERRWWQSRGREIWSRRPTFMGRHGGEDKCDKTPRSSLRVSSTATARVCVSLFHHWGDYVQRMIKTDTRESVKTPNEWTKREREREMTGKNFGGWEKWRLKDWDSMFIAISWTFWRRGGALKERERWEKQDKRRRERERKMFEDTHTHTKPK